MKAMIANYIIIIIIIIKESERQTKTERQSGRETETAFIH